MSRAATTLWTGVQAISNWFGDWHGFTFPSKSTAGSAAQFNSSVSLAPPRLLDLQNHALWRRHEGYTAKG